MNWLIGALVIVVLLFGFVIAFGAPYLPTLSGQKQLALNMLDLKPGQTMLELGSGDGRMLQAAAQRGWHVVGYELNPLLVVVSYIVTWRYRKQIKIVWGNFWQKDWPPADGIYTFLLTKYMPKLDKKIIQYSKKPVKLVSFAFEIPNKKPVKQQQGLNLYQY